LNSFSPLLSPIVLADRRFKSCLGSQRRILKSWSCYVLSILRIHSPDCETCNPGGSNRGEEMRARLEELQRTAPKSGTAVQMDASGKYV
jgi:hypothetical protein